MITRISQVPPKFLDEFMRIVTQHFEPIDSMYRLVEFWLFAVDQGWAHPEMRQQIAEMTFYISNAQTNVDISGGPEAPRWVAFDQWETHATTFDFEFMGEDNEAVVKRYNELWSTLKEDIEAVKQTPEYEEPRSLTT